MIAPAEVRVRIAPSIAGHQIYARRRLERCKESIGIGYRPITRMKDLNGVDTQPALEVTLVLEFGLDAREIDVGRVGIDAKSGLEQRHGPLHFVLVRPRIQDRPGAHGQVHRVRVGAGCPATLDIDEFNTEHPC